MTGLRTAIRQKHSVRPRATHIVIEVSWGAKCLLAVMDASTSNADTTTVHKSPITALELLKQTISGRETADLIEEDLSNGRGFSFQLFGDVQPRKSGEPVTFTDAVNLMRNIPGIVKSTNDGKGRPIAYGLFPINATNFMTSVGLKRSNIVYVKQPNEALVTQFVDLFEEILASKQEVEDAVALTEDYKVCVPAEIRSKIRDIKTEIE